MTGDYLRICPKCETEQGVHGGCDCGHLKAWTPEREGRAIREETRSDNLDDDEIPPDGNPMSAIEPLLEREGSDA